MSKIEPFLGYRLQRWRNQTQEERVASGNDSPIRVYVQFTGEPVGLREAGLTVRSIEGEIAIGLIDLADLERLASLDNVVSIDGDKPVIPHLNVSVPQIHADTVRLPPLSLTGTGVIVGIIDTGIDVQHNSFRKADGSSRILSIWDQTLSHPAQGLEKVMPPPFDKGVLFDRDAIKAAIDHPDQPFRHEDTDGHGSHVAGIAAGNGSQAGHCHGPNTYVGVAPEADLIIVKTAFSEDGDYADGANYIFQQATALAKPAVVNMSFGSSMGAHDGTDTQEKRLDGFLGGGGRVIVVSAGNDGVGDRHASTMVDRNATVTLTFTVPADDYHLDHFDLWYSGTARLQFTIAPPYGAAYDTVNPGDASGYVHRGAGGDAVWVESTVNRDNNRNRIYFTIEPPLGSKNAITAGEWTVTLQETANAQTSVDAWINVQLKDPFPTFIPADQSSARTITRPGTAAKVITVGSYDPSKSILSGEYELAASSSRGPTLAPDHRRKPDICAPGVDIVSAASAQRSHWFCCDCCLDFYVNNTGTSMAAPHVTGVVALMLQRNANQTYDDVRQHIWDTASLPDHIILPDNDWGYGMVNALGSCSGVPPAAGAAGGGGGGGGGSGSGMYMRLPVVTGAVSQPALAARLRMLERQYADNPVWHEVGALISNHFDEVLRLINRNRRVAMAWHRMNGPQLIASFVGSSGDRRYLPLALREEKFRTAHVDRMLMMLARFGSLSLSSDVARYRALILALPRIYRSDLELLATG